MMEPIKPWTGWRVRSRVGPLTASGSGGNMLSIQSAKAKAFIIKNTG